MFFPTPYQVFWVLWQFLIDPDFTLRYTDSINKQSLVKKKFVQTMLEAYFPAKCLSFSVSVMHFPLQPVAVICFPLELALALKKKKVSWEIYSNYFHFYYFYLPLQAGEAFPWFLLDFLLILIYTTQKNLDLIVYILAEMNH